MIKLTKKDLLTANIGRRYAGAKLKALPPGDAKEMIAAYLRGLDDAWKNGDGLYLWGNFSAGKTYTMAVVLKYALQKGYSVRFLSADEFYSLFVGDQDLYKRVGSIDFLRTVDFLGVDDFARVHFDKKLYHATRADNFLRARYTFGNPTLFTANNKLADTKYSKSSKIIISESCHTVKVPEFKMRHRQGIKRRKRLELRKKTLDETWED